MVSFGEPGAREVGSWSGRRFWGRGVATAALSQFLEHVKTLPLHAHGARRNAASPRILEKCGFTVVGRDKVAGDEDINEESLRLA